MTVFGMLKITEEGSKVKYISYTKNDYKEAKIEFRL